jgi:hypothetical protein
MLMKTLIVAMVFLGEAAIIYAEMKGAKAFSHDGSFLSIFMRMALVATVGSFLTLSGYMLGLQSFQNIWIVSATAVTSIVILEPLMAYFVVGQVPTAGALAGFLLGSLGLVLTLFWK